MNEHSQYLQANFGDDMIERIHGAANEIDKLERERDEALADLDAFKSVSVGLQVDIKRLRESIEDALAHSSDKTAMIHILSAALKVGSDEAD